MSQVTPEDYFPKKEEENFAPEFPLTSKSCKSSRIVGYLPTKHLPPRNFGGGTIADAITADKEPIGLKKNVQMSHRVEIDINQQ
jgi:hypothetical protein